MPQSGFLAFLGVGTNVAIALARTEKDLFLRISNVSGIVSTASTNKVPHGVKNHCGTFAVRGYAVRS
jgi:hypothetical protein